jgi:acylphosphatase
VSKDVDVSAERSGVRRSSGDSMGWLIGESTPRSRSNRASQLREWKQVERRDQSGSPRLERWQMLVRGRVQGVGYRSSCCQKAKELDLTGWVRNCPDGSVEVQAEGTVHKLTELRLWCERGPKGAEVHSVSHSQLAPTREDWFEIRI